MVGIEYSKERKEEDVVMELCGLWESLKDYMHLNSTGRAAFLEQLLARAG